MTDPVLTCLYAAIDAHALRAAIEIKDLYYRALAEVATDTHVLRVMMVARSVRYQTPDRRML